MSDAIPLLPMKEALSFWRKKVPMRSADFYRLSEEYRVRAFTVGKLAQLDMIAHVQKSLEGALQQGTSMTQWRSRIEGLFVRAGWTGNTRYRLDTVYRNNIQAAYNAGRWGQAQDGKKDRPYAMYDAVDDGRARPTHAAQDGKVYPLDHPFWRSWWPPNGHRCRCSTRTLSRDDVKDMGLKVEDKIDDVPDEGFQTNPGHTPGEARLLGQLNISKKLADYKPAFRQHFLDAAKVMPYQIMSRYLHQRDIESMQTLIWADKQGGVDGYEKWIDALSRDRLKNGQVASRGRVYPVGNIPPHIASRLSRQPRLTLVVMTDKGIQHLLRGRKKDRGQALTIPEVKSIPQRFRDTKTQWYEDTQNPGTILAWERVGKKKWLKLTFLVNGKIKSLAGVNVVRTAGVVEYEDLSKNDRYKRITY